MARLTKEKRSMLLNIGFILLTMLLVLYLVSQAGDVDQIIAAFASVKPVWLLLATLCFVSHVLLEGLILKIFFYFQHVKISWGSCNLVGLIGMFYSSITPAATGGQPMQAFALKKRNVPSGVGYSSLAVKFFCWQCALLLIGAVLWIFNGSYVYSLLGKGVWLVALGFFFNSVMVVLVIMLAINRNFVRAIIIFGVNILHRLRIVKDKAQTSSKMDAALNDFHSSVDLLTKHRGQFLVLFLFSLVQVTALMSVIYFIYKGFSLQNHTYMQIITIQFLLYITASFTPLPGASGAQEGGFYLFFRNFFPDSVIFAALLIWRFLTYYMFIIVGGIAVSIDQTFSIRRKRKLAEKEMEIESIDIDENPLEEDE
ncbi:MAG: lysylphosphatidylglycerol synthase transmembrane domain-containing protein [Bacillota bacterium]|nr:lysylphosphatidylglycerol synthase transmembrane domain-containing protein [Bacillota bacterium]